MRDFTKSRFTKTIGITEDDYEFIDNTKGKKSKAGRLEEIISIAKKQKTKNKKMIVNNNFE